jgi:RND family efflux transporter MFP subunit
VIQTSVCFGSLVFCLLPGCHRGSAQPPAASTEKPRDESALAKTTLTKEQRQSLGIVSESVTEGKAVRHEPVQEYLKLSGWVVARPGHEVTLTAPAPGHVVLARPGKEFIGVGVAVSEKSEVCRLQPILTPVDQVQLLATKMQLLNMKRGLQSDLAKATEGGRVAESDLQRVTDLHRQKIRSEQDLEQAQARAKYAREDLAAAKDKLKLFETIAAGALDGKLPEMPVLAPLSGKVLAVHVGTGQFVAAGAPLVTIGDLSRPWLRVPIPEQELPRWKRDRPARLLLPGARSGREVELQTAETDPVQVDLARHTADAFYELSTVKPSDGKPLPGFHKDEMLTVQVPLGESRERTVVPAAAVVFDIHGGSWIYLERSPPDAKESVFERRRVQLGPRVSTGQVITPALAREDRIVTTGAAALFSREFYKPPAPGPAKEVDDDDG